MKRFLACCLLLAVLTGCGAAVPAAGLKDTRQVPILMYHSVLKDPARTGAYVIAPERLEQDLLWLLNEGYETVVLGDLLRFVRGAGELPEKPVVITFDDGYLNNVTYVLPLLQKHGCRAVLSVVGAYTARFSENPDPNPSYAYVAWDDVTALRLTDRFEIQNHTFDMHGQSGRMGSGRRRGESQRAYAAAFTKDVQRLQEELANRCGVTPEFFTYPFGLIDPDSRALLEKLGFSGSLSCAARWNTVTQGDGDCLWGMGRYNRPGDLSTEAFMGTVFG